MNCYAIFKKKPVLQLAERVYRCIFSLNNTVSSDLGHEKPGQDDRDQHENADDRDLDFAVCMRFFQEIPMFLVSERHAEPLSFRTDLRGLDGTAPDEHFGIAAVGAGETIVCPVFFQVHAAAAVSAGHADFFHVCTFLSAVY